jgi:hypothetical protein
MLKGGLSALGGRARNELRGKPIQFIAASVLPEGDAETLNPKLETWGPEPGTRNPLVEAV